MQRRALLSAVAAPVLVLGLSACSGGGDKDEADITSDIADQLAESGLDDEAATCFAEVIVDEIGAEALKDIDFSAEEPPEELQEEFASAAVTALGTCDIDTESLGE